MLKIPEHMYSKGPKNNPAPGKNPDTTGNRAYGDSDLTLLTGGPEGKINNVKIFDMEYKYEDAKSPR